MDKLTLQQAFMNGLRNEPYVNSEFLVNCRALKPTAAGLEPFRNLVILDDPADVDWPGNRIEDVGSTQLIFNADGVYTLGTIGVPSERVPVFDSVYAPIATGFCTYLTPGNVNVTYGPNPLLEPQAIVRIAVRRGTSTSATFDIYIDGVLDSTHPLEDAWTIVALVKPNDNTTQYRVRPTTNTPIGGTVEYTLVTQWATPFVLVSEEWNFVKSEEFNDVWFVQAGYDPLGPGGDVGRVIVYHIPSNGTVGAHPSLKWALLRHAGSDVEPTNHNSRYIGSIARHMGRLYMGGFHPDNPCFSSTIALKGAKSWEYFWQSFLENVEVELTHEGMTIGKNVIFYSKLNGGDYFWPFAVEMAMLSCPSESAFEDAAPFLLDAVRKKEIGFFEVPTIGHIQRLESVDRALYIFATDGIFIAVQNPTDFGTGHAVFKVSDVPLKHISSGLNKGMGVYFVNANDNLCFADQEGVKVIGYKVQLKTLTGYVQMDYDNEEDDLYISGDNRCFVLTRTGMGEYGAPVSSFVSVLGVLTGYAGVPESRTYVLDPGPPVVTVTRVVALMTTETLDFIERMLKDIHSIELGISNAVNIRYRILYRIHGDPVWESTDWMNVYDTSGFTTPITSGHDLRLEIELELQGYDQDEYTKLEYINLLWRRSDKRNFRLHRTGRL